jgi:hypothetical protein
MADRKLKGRRCDEMRIVYTRSQRCFDDDEKEKKSFYQFESEFRITPFEMIDLWLSTSILCSNLTKRKEVNLDTS